MDPSHDGRGHKKDSFSDQSSSQKHGNAPPPMAAPPMYYPPPAMGYHHPGPPMPHQGYPPGYGPYPNEYPPPPHAYHYPAAPYPNAPPTHNKGGGAKAFVRGFIMCSCLIFTFLFLATFIMALLLHPQLPIYTVDSLSVANFNTTPTLTADWNTSITIHNINDKLNGYFSDLKVDLLHKDDLLASNYVPNFVLDKNEYKQFNTKPSLNGVAFPKWDLDGMKKEQASGSLTLSLRITSMVAFKSNTMSTRDTLILALCEDLKVVFQNNTGIGTLENKGTPIICQLYM